LERRRQRAVEAVRQGDAPATVARVLGVDRTTVYRWLKQADRPGGLAARQAVRTPRLSDAQLGELEQLLLKGAHKHGWSNNLWTAARVAVLIERHFGVGFHPEHVRKMLKRRLNWTSQKPQRRARQRNEDEIARWLAEDFPPLAERTRRRDAHLVLLDESCFQLVPTVRRTLAPRGKTPKLDCQEGRDKISAISCITLSPLAQRPGLYFWLLPDGENVHAEEVVAFLSELHKVLGRMTVVWDRNQIHSRARAVKAFLREHPDVEVADFPGYAPELNPDELVWGWTKYGRLCNEAPADRTALRERVETELTALRRRRDLLRAFIRHTKLPLAG